MLEDARVHRLLTRSVSAGELANAKADRSVPGRRVGELSSPKSREICKNAAGTENLAYVMYTSGRPERPRGWMIPARGDRATTDGEGPSGSRRRNDRVMQKTPFALTLPYGSFMAPLLVRRPLVYRAVSGGHRDGAYLLKSITDRTGHHPALVDRLAVGCSWRRRTSRSVEV